MKENKPKFRIEHWHLLSLLLVAFDIVAIGGSYFLALLMRESSIIGTTQKNALKSTFFAIGRFEKSQKKSTEGVFSGRLCVVINQIVNLRKNVSERSWQKNLAGSFCCL